MRTPGRGTVTGLTVLAAAALLLAGTHSWVELRATDATTTLPAGELTGGLAQALAVVAGAAVLLGLTLRARGRQVLGAGLVLVGLAAAWTGLRPPAPSEQAARAALSRVSLADSWQSAATAWPWVYALAGLLLAAGGVLTVLLAPRWATHTDRFRRDPAPPAAGTVPTGPGAAGTDDPALLWRALDAGEDPTAPAPDRDPISPTARPGDRMRPTPDPEGRP